MSTTIKIRRDTLTNWQTENPTPYEGEMSLVTDLTPQRIKIGDGTTPFNSLPYFTLPNATTSVAGLMTAADKIKLDGLPNSPITTQGGIRIAGKAVGDAVRVHFTVTGSAYTYTVGDTPVKLAVYGGQGYFDENITLPVGEHDVYFVFSNPTQIPEAAFKGEDKITAADIPPFVRSIDNEAFKGTSLTKLTCRAQLPPTLGTAVFDGVDPDSLTIEVYPNDQSAYSDDAEWSTAGIVTPMS